MGGVGALSASAQPSCLAPDLPTNLSSLLQGLELRVSWPGVWGASTEPTGCLCWILPCLWLAQCIPFPADLICAKLSVFPSPLLITGI